MGFKIFGQVRELETRHGISDVVVQALDKDFLSDDLLGEVTTDQNGFFSIEYTEETGKDLFDQKPDVYLVVKSNSGKILTSTQNDIRVDVDRTVEINVDITRPALVEAGLIEQEPVHWMKDLDPDYQKRFTAWTWQSGFDESDKMMLQLRDDMAGRSSILELMKHYINELKGNKDNNAPPFLKMAKLFELGITPNCMEGHHYGVPVAIRTGDQEGPAAEFGNILGFLWGVTLDDISPWVGKSFASLDADKFGAISGITEQPENLAYLGINHFNKINFQPLNTVSFYFLTCWMGLEDVSQEEKASFGHEKNGGNFIAIKAPSVYHGTNREVFQLNYRWRNIGNPPPFCWLVDEVVQIAEGLYLGQLLFCTRRLQNDYDPKQPASDAGYQHFGYFLLFDKTWNPEARRLLPHLEMPVIAPGLKKVDVAGSCQPSKFSTFTFEKHLPPNTNDEVLARIYDDLKGKPTIMHLLKYYSDELLNNLDNNSPYFLRLQEIFNRGIGIETIRGFYRGALISWHSEGLLRFLDLNAINLAHMQIGRYFSTWTGKTFEDILPLKLKEMTGGHETGEIPTCWGANTQSLRTIKEKLTGKLMKLADVWMEDVPADEAREFGYDLKCFFFIGRQAESVNRHNKGKTVFQFNYRWPNLKTIPPDCYCVDELVQIADNLYLGQLMYATELLMEYDPLKDPAEYKYRLFGYFLLMDEAWHRVRLDIGFDLENV